MPYSQWNGGHWSAPGSKNVTCPTGYYVTGLSGTTRGSSITNVDAVYCKTLAQINADNLSNIASVATRLPGGGGWGGGAAWKTECPPGKVVVGVDGKCRGHLVWLRLSCQDPFAIMPAQLQSVMGQYSGGREYNNSTFGKNTLVTGIALRWQRDIRWFGVAATDATQDILAVAKSAAPTYTRSCLGLDAQTMVSTPPNPAACTQLLSQWCVASAANLAQCGTASFCQGAGRAYCDAAYTTLCQAVNSNPSAPDSEKKACACSAQTPALATIPGYIPSCHNGDCFKSTAYHTLEMQNTSCPPLVVCEQNLVLTNVERANLSNIHMVNDCSGNSASSSKTTIVPGSAPPPVPTTQPLVPTTQPLVQPLVPTSQPLVPTTQQAAPPARATAPTLTGSTLVPPPNTTTSGGATLVPQSTASAAPAPTPAPTPAATTDHQQGLSPVVIVGGLGVLVAGLGVLFALRSRKSNGASQ